MRARTRTTAWVSVLAGLFLAALPAQAGVVVVGELFREHTVQPGGTAEGSIVLQNTSDEPAEIRLYQTDYLFFADGRSMYGEPGRLPRSNARWINWSPRQLVIPPRDSVTVRYTIQVPNDPGLRGTTWSMMMVEPVPRDSPESTAAQPVKSGVNLRELVRYAIQIATHIGGTGRRQLGFTQARLLAENGKNVLAVDVENTGERLLRGGLTADLYDSNGRHVNRYEAERRLMYPGTSVRFKIDLLGLDPVTYKSLIVVDCGGDDVFGASVDLVLGH